MERWNTAHQVVEYDGIGREVVLRCERLRRAVAEGGDETAL